MSRIPREIYELVRKRPRTVAEIIAHVWQLHPQDAPARSCIKAHIWRINRELSGKRIVGEWGGATDGSRRDGYYVLKAI